MLVGFGRGLRAAIMAVLGAVVAPIAAQGHEFWIEPHAFAIAPGDDIIADIKVGQELVGDTFPFVTERVAESGILDGEERRTLGSRTGDLPAIDETAENDGLAIVWLEIQPSGVEHDWETFTEFAEYEGIEWVLDAHAERGLATDSFVEIYTRCAKALVDVGDGGGADQALGMPIEIVADANPYDSEPDGDAMLGVRLLWRGEPLEGAQIRVFRENDGVSETVLRTDAGGHADVPLHDGGKFLLNAVHIVPPDDVPDVAWHSFWATLTFEVEAR